jgi:hypothetical protein
MIGEHSVATWNYSNNNYFRGWISTNTVFIPYLQFWNYILNKVQFVTIEYGQLEKPYDLRRHIQQRTEMLYAKGAKGSGG